MPPVGTEQKWHSSGGGIVTGFCKTIQKIQECEQIFKNYCNASNLIIDSALNKLYLEGKLPKKGQSHMPQLVNIQ